MKAPYPYTAEIEKREQTYRFEEAMAQANKQEAKKTPTIFTIDPSETFPLYLRIVEMARAITNDDANTSLTYDERFNAALIAVAFEHGKNAK